MGKIICEAIPFKNFKEKVRIVKAIERNYKLAKISINENMIIVRY
ncbi:hypothetical protein [Clostridium perfringens]|nr:hypothetical protein [Clostridium perfringens]MDK3122645.1 hypothetical protein [Clostridium perfringens]